MVLLRCPWSDGRCVTDTAAYARKGFKDALAGGGLRIDGLSWYFKRLSCDVLIIMVWRVLLLLQA